MYIHEDPAWPQFRWNDQALARILGDVRHRQGRLLGQMQALGFRLRDEANLLSLTENVVQTSEIEGEALDRRQVRSSLARRLGMDIGGLLRADRHVEGIVEMTLDATRHYDRPLTAQRLQGWQASLFPEGWSGLSKIRVGAWRDDKEGPMHVVSGPGHRERVHFQAPAAARLEGEMAAFLEWFNSGPDLDWVLKAGLAHFWFVTIHPFADGNGRIARAISDLCLARSEQSSQRFYSMSAQIRQERNAYYDILEGSQKGGMDATPWLGWFVGCLERALAGAENLLESVLAKARFWDRYRSAPINERQRRIINRLLDGFEGKLTSSKWAKLTRCSHDTALRDLADLVERGILMKGREGGRSTNYTLAPP